MCYLAKQGLIKEWQNFEDSVSSKKVKFAWGCRWLIGQRNCPRFDRGPEISLKKSTAPTVEIVELL
jgi:hypothetical protein